MEDTADMDATDAVSMVLMAVTVRFLHLLDCAWVHWEFSTPFDL